LSGFSFTALGKVAPIAGVVALVVVTQTAATSRAFAEHSGRRVDAGQDLLGVGAGSVLAGFAGAFPVNASPPRTAAVVSAGGRSQLAGLLAAAGIIALIPAAGLLKDLPLATLAGVLVYVATHLFHVGDLKAIGRFNKIEFALAIITLLTVALVGVVQGIGVAVGLAILDRTRISDRAHLHPLGRIPGTTSWAPLEDPHTTQVSGVLVVLFTESLWYANASHFAANLKRALDGRREPTRALVLDVVGMHDVDFTGARVLGELIDDLERRRIAFAIARAGDTVRANLTRAGLTRRIGDEHFYSSVDEAVTEIAPSA
jgi:MFS superfamily sulfate permease-like transporter